MLWEKEIKYDKDEILKTNNVLFTIGYDLVNSLYDEFTYRDFYNELIESFRGGLIKFLNNSNRNSSVTSFGLNTSIINKVKPILVQNFNNLHGNYRTIVENMMRKVIERLSKELNNKEIINIFNYMKNEGVIDKFSNDLIDIVGYGDGYKELEKEKDREKYIKNYMNTFTSMVTVFTLLSTFVLTYDKFRITTENNNSQVPLGLKSELYMSRTEDTIDEVPSYLLSLIPIVYNNSLNVIIDNNVHSERLRVMSQNSNRVYVSFEFISDKDKISDFINTELRKMKSVPDTLRLSDVVKSTYNFMIINDVKFVRLHLYSLTNQTMFYDTLLLESDIVYDLYNYQYKYQKKIIEYFVDRYIMKKSVYPVYYLSQVDGSLTPYTIEITERLLSTNYNSDINYELISERINDIIENSDVKKLQKIKDLNDLLVTNIDFIREFNKLNYGTRRGIKNYLNWELTKKMNKKKSKKKKKKQDDNKPKFEEGINKYNSIVKGYDIIEKLTNEGILKEGHYLHTTPYELKRRLYYIKKSLKKEMNKKKPKYSEEQIREYLNDIHYLQSLSNESMRLLLMLLKNMSEKPKLS